MTGPDQLADRMAALLAVSTADARRRFADGRNGQLLGSGVVHLVALQQWFGLQVPAPACHVGTGGWDFTRFEPTRAAVSCGRCLRGGAGRAAPAPGDLDQLQLKFGD